MNSFVGMESFGMFRVGLFLLKHYVLISLLFIMKGFSKSFIIIFCFPESKHLKLIKFQSANLTSWNKETWQDIPKGHTNRRER